MAARFKAFSAGLLACIPMTIPYAARSVGAALMPVVGTFFDFGPAILIIAPLVHPVAQQLGIDPMQISIFIMLTLAMGLLTPLVGGGVFRRNAGSQRPQLAGHPVDPALFLARLAVIVLICLVPEISRIPPGLLN